MNNFSVNILRSGLVLLYLGLIACVILAIGSVYSYLNTGADRSKMLHTEQLEQRTYRPIITWDTTAVKGRSVNKTMLATIEKDYLNAWRVKANALKNNDINGVSDFYTKRSLGKLKSIIDYNIKNGTTVEMTTLEHHPKIEFMSEDGQIVVISDTEVLQYQKTYQDNQIIDEQNTSNDYKVVLLLQDGHWHIRHLVSTGVRSITSNFETLPLHSKVRGINYYPQKFPWDTFNDSITKATFDSDFNLLKNQGINTIRIFIGYEDFGKEYVQSKKVNKLLELLDSAHSNDLDVLVTLFDFYGNYDVEDWTMTTQHLNQLIPQIMNHPALLGYDLKNEPDLDYENRSPSMVDSWLEQMIYRLKLLDQDHPVTIGWSNAQAATGLSEDVDFVSFHYYEDLDELSNKWEKLRSQLSEKEIVITEYGWSSYTGILGLSSSEKEQAEYHKKANSILKEKKIPAMSWTLYDFNQVPDKVTGILPWRRNPQKFYGFIDVHGNKKPTFKHLSN
ncbi:glycosyl hydrolase [Nonlabens tegetincola]|uniref:glycosyl hydrolase n=1 Tax=Nonlabens tegetincola TaxID=323273 RepID=UPI000CF54E28|nr:glycosyl hydrolase [Nonlabens tegetincola]PQJ20142.1 glycosyl hydrolase family 5 [Nonlabens tegetincola]